MSETKICEWCEKPFRRGNITPAKWKKRRCCSVSHSSKLIAKERARRQREMAALITDDPSEPGWDGVVFSTIDPGDGGFMRVPRPETHVQYGYNY